MIMPTSHSPTFSQPGFTNSDEELDVYDDGCLHMEHNNFYVTCKGKRIRLTLKEFLILSRLVRKPERVVSPNELWQYVWGNDKKFAPTTLRMQIHNLRKRLAPHGLTIEVMQNAGYFLTLTPCCKAKDE
jgi:DNA-binding response OmpR family regulator